MPSRRRIEPAEGHAALRAWQDARARGGPVPGRPVLATAVRWSLEELAARYPGATCEVRVPPFAVAQCLPGPRHTRGTPPNVVEADAETWLAVATGVLTWSEAVTSGRLRASGERADLSDLLPLDRPGPATAPVVG